MSAEVQKFMVTKNLEQGQRFELAGSSERAALLQSVVDYRGDVTLHLKNGDRLEVFVFNYDGVKDRLDFFMKGGAQPAHRLVSDIVAIEISGVDTAKGKSWEDYQARKREEAAARA